ncbi:MAG: hypothetical protein IPG04_15070 [Polyangiaceae bacterium]|nr:hypothetical protein [Polyangiaceae bacterium]
MTPAARMLLLLPTALFASGCVISCNDGSDGYQCDEEKCCDEWGCYPIDDDGQGGSDGTGGFGSGGAAQGGAPAACDPALFVCACGDSSECALGLACLDGQCLEACTFDYECADGQVCADGRCVAACDAESPCAPGTFCQGGGCLVDDAYVECASASDCAGGACVAGLCTTLCASNAGCPEGELCDAASGSCFADPTPTPACDEVTPCAGDAQSCFDDGYCHYGCVVVEDCKLIDARFDACDEGVCKTAEELSPACSFELPCADGSPCVSNQCAGPV